MTQNNSLIEKATILAVDDTPDNLLLISGLLKTDYHVRVANGGQRAIKIAQSESPRTLSCWIS